MKFDYYTFNIGAPYMSAIFNGDESGLTALEISDLNAFMDDLPVKNGHFDLVDYDGEGSFSLCDISGLYSECLEVRLYFPISEARA